MDITEKEKELEVTAATATAATMATTTVTTESDTTVNTTTGNTTGMSDNAETVSNTILDASTKNSDVINNEEEDIYFSPTRSRITATMNIDVTPGTLLRSNTSSAAPSGMSLGDIDANELFPKTPTERTAGINVSNNDDINNNFCYNVDDDSESNSTLSSNISNPYNKTKSKIANPATTKAYGSYCDLRRSLNLLLKNNTKDSNTKHAATALEKVVEAAKLEYEKLQQRDFGNASSTKKNRSSQASLIGKVTDRNKKNSSNNNNNNSSVGPVESITTLPATTGTNTTTTTTPAATEEGLLEKSPRVAQDLQILPINNSEQVMAPPANQQANPNIVQVAYQHHVSFSMDNTLVQKILSTAMEPIDYGNEEILEIAPVIDESIFGALSTVTKTTIKLAAIKLFQADVETQNARNVLDLFKIPTFIPQSIRLTPKLQRKKDYEIVDDETSRALEKEFKLLNSSYIPQAKAIMLKDKYYLLGLTQEHSRKLTLDQLLRIVQSKYSSTVSERITECMLRINDSIPIETLTAPPVCNAGEAKSLTIGFAFLLLFTGKASKPLERYLGQVQTKMLLKASAFVLQPKPVIQSDGNNNINLKQCIRIGNLTFQAPSKEVWTHATSIATDLEQIVTHITLEQRCSYTLQENRSRALTAVRKWGIRQEFVSCSMSVADIIKNSTLEETKVLTEQNTWRRAIYERLLKTIGKDIKKLASVTTTKADPIPKTLTPRNSTAPNAQLEGSKALLVVDLTEDETKAKNKKEKNKRDKIRKKGKRFEKLAIEKQKEEEKTAAVNAETK